ncbi:MAG: D-aminoacyl-tRNA deacylase [candidate division Zixibacteria bacterium]|nr:D-aminoacyl-tRNA deacylase [candidate division Zixibacteria bacterium]MDH3936753.1 D-aminoacyl-tRNA deacylase [candidate division Zixibacteria bacterium]MDH4033016.1 D-aminoacyl-tRNA deacylase [candidate division Zixibacteria bacterium]
MRLVVQRTSGVEVWIDGKLHSSTAAGLLVLFGTRKGDQEQSCAWLADKLINLRVFEDEADKMNLSALDIGGEIMVVSQFTLYADTRKGRRPSYNEAMEPAQAEQLYDSFIRHLGGFGLKVAAGLFGAKMDVRFTNVGPVTVIVDHDG